MTNDDIQKRAQELVSKAAEKAGVTLERIVADDASRPGLRALYEPPNEHTPGAPNRPAAPTV